MISSQRIKLGTIVAVLLLSVVTQFMPAQAYADTKPLLTTEPATVSADALPTVQINGVVWSQAVIDNTVYAVGKFTTARPAGVALGGAGSVARVNILAYNITTGVLNTSFVHKLEGTDAEGKTITVSPDKTKIFVGGKFSSVDGKARSNLAVFDAKTGALLNGFPGPNKVVSAVSATNSRLFIGGSFSSVGSVARKSLAAYDIATGVLASNWAPSTNLIVSALIVSPDNTKVIIGGPFSQINGQNFYGSGAVTVSTGATVPWASSSLSYPIQNSDTVGYSSSISGFSKNSSMVFVSAWSYTGITTRNWMEGTAAINPTNGAIIWLNDCHGDTYSTFPQGNVLYSVGHAHDCGGMGAFPELSGPNKHQFALAQDIAKNGVNLAPTFGYPSKQGIAKTTLLNWFPKFGYGTATDAGQAGWTVTGNASYIAIGGEFPTVNGKPQQGLVRFATAAIAPNKVGPAAYNTGVVKNGPVINGSVLVTVRSTYDNDNRSLTYKFYRDSGTTPVKTITASSTFWDRPNVTFTDINVPAGAHKYKVLVTDAYGNSVNGPAAAVTGCHATLGMVNSICVNEPLEINQSIYSENGKYRLTMQANGNLVLFSNGKVVWTTNTAGTSFGRFRMQDDGNIAIFSHDRNIVRWNLERSFPSPYGFVLQNDGNMGIYNTANRPIWASNTNGL